MSLKSIPAVAALLAIALPLTPAAARIVPPENSAASQYTESYPAAGGGTIPTDRTTAGKGSQGSPAEALGERNLRRLRALGPEGEATASLAAGTAPAGGTAAGGGGAAGEDQAASRLAGNEPGESSGLTAVLSRAVGSSGGGGEGPLVPLTIACLLVGSVVYLWRRRTSLGHSRS